MVLLKIIMVPSKIILAPSWIIIIIPSSLMLPSLDINGTISDIVTTITGTHNQNSASSNLASLVISLLGACKANTGCSWLANLLHSNKYTPKLLTR